MKNKLFIGLAIAACLSLSGCQKANDQVNGNGTANTNTTTNSNVVASTNANSNVTANINANTSVMPSNSAANSSNQTSKTDVAAKTGCQPVTAVNFKKGTFGQTFKCEMDAESYRHKYTLNAKAGQMFDIQFETGGCGTAPQAVYTVAGPDGKVKTRDEGGNSGLQFDKSGKWTVTVDMNSTATRPCAEYTITFTIGNNDDEQN